MRQNERMKDNLRLFFSLMWFVAVGCTAASLFAVVISWGGYLEYFVAALIALAVTTAGSIITSL